MSSMCRCDNAERVCTGFLLTAGVMRGNNCMACDMTVNECRLFASSELSGLVVCACTLANV